jgi:hypothetical protein
MAYSQEDKDRIIDSICEEMCKGRSLRDIIANDKGLISMPVFYEWLDADESKAKQYARACNIRQELMFEDILKISDCEDNDMYTDKEGNERVNHDVIQRDNLRVNSRKWVLSRMNPKKYGDKMDLTSDGEKIESGAKIVWGGKEINV